MIMPGDAGQLLQCRAVAEVCGTCMDARGLDDAALMMGARGSTMAKPPVVTTAADKVMVF
jgi:sulfur relay (sulfurtransferase) complex TusBCD TusD component (DsrE family)